jgi:hypothetical protein
MSKEKEKPKETDKKPSFGEIMKKISKVKPPKDDKTKEKK